MWILDRIEGDGAIGLLGIAPVVVVHAINVIFVEAEDEEGLFDFSHGNSPVLGKVGARHWAKGCRSRARLRAQVANSGILVSV